MFFSWLSIGIAIKIQCTSCQNRPNLLYSSLTPSNRVFLEHLQHPLCLFSSLFIFLHHLTKQHHLCVRRIQTHFFNVNSHVHLSIFIYFCLTLPLAPIYLMHPWFNLVILVDVHHMITCYAHFVLIQLSSLWTEELSLSFPVYFKFKLVSSLSSFILQLFSLRVLVFIDLRPRFTYFSYVCFCMFPCRSIDWRTASNCCCCCCSWCEEEVQSWPSLSVYVRRSCYRYSPHVQ